MWYVLGFLVLMALGQAFFFSIQSGRTIPYSEFKTLVRDGKVQDVTVAEDRVKLVLPVADAGQRVAADVVEVVVAEVPAARPLEQVAADRGGVADLRRGGVAGGV